ncbi:MAG: HAMP domain-containing histidine kinase [Chromatiales bacterium]|jgi:signal transduction histidine kinase|nr:HAMP domain-containing histidine kinase [Chromatiales bacterium]
MHVNDLLARRHEHRILALMLVVAHGAVWIDFGGAVSRSLLLAHFGLFLLWQPIWQREERLAWAGTAVSLACIIGVLVWLDWWVITVWLVLLIGLVGGRMTEGRLEQSAYMMAMVFLVSELLIGVIPPMFDIQIFGLVETITRYGLVGIPFILMFIPVNASGRKAPDAVDFLYGLTVSLLVSVLAMGALLRWYDAGVIYLVALFQTTVGLGVFLLAISWLWAPFAGFSGLGQLWTRYLMNIGTPFELWLQRIATLSRRLQRPGDFLSAAMRELLALPWVRGVQWSVDRQGTATQLGEDSGHQFAVRDGGLDVTVWTHGQIGTALALHGKLLVGLLAHFHRAKEREVESTNQAHMEAVHQTGARITHDIKNLLQSLYALTSAMGSASDDKSRRELLNLLERQLPLLSGRLQSALDKLQAPELDSLRSISASEWWEEFCQRHERAHIELRATLDADRNVPADLFDSVTENLLENARYKQQSDPDVKIIVDLTCNAEELVLSVTDTGYGLPTESSRDLLKAPVQSQTGLGIGLFQSARHAEQLGYQLRTAAIHDGLVTFELVDLHGHGNALPADLT